MKHSVSIGFISEITVVESGETIHCSECHKKINKYLFLVNDVNVCVKCATTKHKVSKNEVLVGLTPDLNQKLSRFLQKKMLFKVFVLF